MATFQLSSEAQRLIEELLRTGRYDSAEEVVLAGLGSLDQQERYGDFLPGEMEGMLAEGERSIELEGDVDASTLFADLRARFFKPAQ
jgi:Arc/MetJ-type ribon-helix-helix transcriptional regulator